MPKKLLFFLFVIIFLVVIMLFWPKNSKPAITSFEDCLAAGNPVLESYPRQCTTKDGRNFAEKVIVESKH